AGRDVAGDALVEPELPEEAEGRGEALLAVTPLVLDGGELGQGVRLTVGRHAGSSRVGGLVSVRLTSPRERPTGTRDADRRRGRGARAGARRGQHPLAA